MPEGGVQVVELGKLCAVTSIALATVVVMLGVACVMSAGVPCPVATLVGLAVDTPDADWAPRNSGLIPFAALEALLNAGAAASATLTAPISAAPSTALPHEVHDFFIFIPLVRRYW